MVNIRKVHGVDNMSAKEVKVIAEEFRHCIANLVDKVIGRIVIHLNGR